MKKFVYSLMSIAISLAISVLVSCQKEYLAESNNPPMRYLSVSPNFLSNPSFAPNDSNTINFEEAFTRIVGIDGKTFFMKAQTANEANVSQELFTYLTKLIKNSNLQGTRVSPFKNNNDCVPRTVCCAYAFLRGQNPTSEDFQSEYENIYISVCSYILKKYGKEGLPWDDLGIEYEKLLKKCFGYCQKERFLRNDYPSKEDIISPTTCIGVLNNTGDKSIYHSIVIKWIKNGVAQYYDPTFNKYSFCYTSEIMCLYKVAIPKSNSVELTHSLNKEY